VIVDDFNFFGIAVPPHKTDSVAIVDANAPLAGSITSKRFETISGGRPQVVQAFRHVELRKPAERHALDRDESRDTLEMEKGFGISALE